MAYAPTDPHAGAYAQYDRNAAAMNNFGNSVMAGVSAYQANKEADIKNQMLQMQMDKAKKDAAYQQGLAGYLQNAQGTENPAYAQHMAAYSPEASAYSQLSPQAQQFVQADAGPSSDMMKGRQDLAMASKPMPQETIPPDYAALSQAYAMQQGNIPEYMRMEQENKKHDQQTINEIMALAGKVKEKGLSPKTVTPLITSLASTMKDPKMKELFSDLSIDDNWSGIKSTVTVDGTEGYVHPVTGKPITMPGIYNFQFDGNAKPIAADFVKELTNKQETENAKLQNQMEIAKLRSETAMQIAGMRGGGRGGSGNGGGASGKPMPPAIVKEQGDLLDKISTASSINSDLSAVEAQLSSGSLKLGPIRNAFSSAKNATGLSDEASQNYSSFKATLEKLRNDSLRLNKGVQTDGDAQRAWNELMKNINDPGVVKKRLGEIQRINDRAVKIHENMLNTMRSEYGKDEMDTTPYTSQPSALKKGAKPPAGRKTASDPMGIL